MSANMISPMADFLTTDDAAEALRVHADTLKRWRKKGQGPKPCRIGGRVFYRESDLRIWVEEEAAREFIQEP